MKIGKVGSSSVIEALVDVDQMMEDYGRRIGEEGSYNY